MAECPEHSRTMSEVDALPEVRDLGMTAYLLICDLGILGRPTDIDAKPNGPRAPLGTGCGDDPVCRVAKPRASRHVGLA